MIVVHLRGFWYFFVDLCIQDLNHLSCYRPFYEVKHLHIYQEIQTVLSIALLGHLPEFGRYENILVFILEYTSIQIKHTIIYHKIIIHNYKYIY